MEEFLTVQEVAQQYRREESVIRRACINGWVPAIKRANAWFISRADAEERWGGKTNKEARREGKR